MKLKGGEIPHFVKIRGCSNCEIVKNCKGGININESRYACTLYGCDHYGFDLIKRFIDPEEIFKIRNHKEMNEPRKFLFKSYIKEVKENFGKYYEQMDISLDEIIKNL